MSQILDIGEKYSFGRRSARCEGKVLKFIIMYGEKFLREIGGVEIIFWVERISC